MRSSSWPWHRHVVPLILGGLALTQPCAAHFANVGERVPLDRLLRNVERYVQGHPNDAKGHYTMGRLHSLGFCQRATQAFVILIDRETERPLPLPRFPYDASVLEPLTATPNPSDLATRRHLLASVKSYRHATELSPGTSLYWLGLGWMLEQGAPLASAVDAPFLAKPGKAPLRQWQDQALEAYRRAYTLDRSADLKQVILAPSADASIALEAGEGILRILEARGPTVAEKDEALEVAATIKSLQNKPRVVTPIVFPLDGAASLTDLLDPSRSVSFDLAGDGRAERWPWVGPNAGFLVWDPEGSGRIVSGRQLFGSATWSMFWHDGYEPLAALDDDGNGWLSGPELTGLAVWRDGNGNGVSERGEVRPLTGYGVVEVSVRATGLYDGVPCNLQGMRRADGTLVPTFDWMPVAQTGVDRRQRAYRRQTSLAQERSPATSRPKRVRN
jgi:hypothetical protein